MRALLLAAVLASGAELPGLKQPPAPECSAGSRRAPHDPSCCTIEMLDEIARLRESAHALAEKARAALEHPDAVSEPLWEHFRVKVEDGFAISELRDLYEGMLEAFLAPDVTFACRDKGDAVCKGRRAYADHCPSALPRKIALCGDLKFGPPFFSEGPWHELLLHQYAHIGCSRSGRLLQGRAETPRGRKVYPGEDPSRNPDSYVGFALAVEKLKL